MIQELEQEIKKLAPEAEKISEGPLGHAITLLNSKTRSNGLSASELHFCRDPHRGINLHLDDQMLTKKKEEERTKKIQSKLKTKGEESIPFIQQGDVVHIRHEHSKHTARSPHLVTKVGYQTLTRKPVPRSRTQIISPGTKH